MNFSSYGIGMVRELGAGGWRDLLGGRQLGIVTVLAGGVALYATNVYLTTSLLPSAVMDIGGERFYAWVTTVYLIASVSAATVVSPLLGWAGSRGAYLLALGAFAVGTLVCAVAPGMHVLLAGRAVQGAAGGLLAGLAYAVINLALPQRLWTRASALTSAMWGVGTFVGPAAGGLFAQWGLWRWAFGMLAAITVGIAAMVPVVRQTNSLRIFPATHYVAGPERMGKALEGIEQELEERLSELEGQGKLLEAQRLRMRTNYDIEMMRNVGFCSGIENYSRHIDGRGAGTPPATLLDYFPDDFLLVIDESHVTVPQIGAMYEGDMSRKRNLVDFGFRLPSAVDNRPLTWEEFADRIGQTVYLSATPGNYERSAAGGEFVEQVIRPTGLVDPKVVVKPTKGQIDDLIASIRQRTEADERVLVTTLTKKMAEDLTDYLLEMGIRVRYLHSEVDTLRRVELLRQLRLGEYDVLVGINLLREGLDLPEVSLVAILDADKEGFLRSSRSLIQTIGRAARNVSGEVHMYADTMTDSMKEAIEETDRRRAKQIAYNQANGIDPQPLRKKIADILDQVYREAEDTEEVAVGGSGRNSSRGRRAQGEPGRAVSAGVFEGRDTKSMPRAELADLIKDMTEQMMTAARDLQFELAARFRDEIADLKKELRGMDAAGLK
ncbi:UvrABC system protein B (UvrB protein) excinuclease [Mycobacteroides abscessus]|nr:UvrABC system protein B (UvrB protein) excinuclease [Mycobacteroides abscessus]